MKKTRKPMGRPPTPNGHVYCVSASVSKVEKYLVHKEAAEAGLSVSGYTRRKLGLDRGVDGEMRTGAATALDIATKYGGIDGDHHKTWVIDQMVRAITGPDYKRHVAEACDGEYGPGTYSWDCGIAP